MQVFRLLLFITTFIASLLVTLTGIRVLYAECVAQTSSFTLAGLRQIKHVVNTSLFDLRDILWYLGKKKKEKRKMSTFVSHSHLLLREISLTKKIDILERHVNEIADLGFQITGTDHVSEELQKAKETLRQVQARIQELTLSCQSCMEVL